MAVLIPSKKIYRINNPKIINNQISVLQLTTQLFEENASLNVLLQNDFIDTSSYDNGFVDCENSSSLNLSNFTYELNSETDDYSIFLSACGIRPVYGNFQFQIPIKSSDTSVGSAGMYAKVSSIEVDIYEDMVEGFYRKSDGDYTLTSIAVSHIDDETNDWLISVDAGGYIRKTETITEIPLNISSNSSVGRARYGGNDTGTDEKKAPSTVKLTSQQSDLSSIQVETDESGKNYIFSAQLLCGCELFKLGSSIPSSFNGSYAYISGIIRQYKPKNITLEIYGDKYTFSASSEVLETHNSNGNASHSLSSNELIQRKYAHIFSQLIQKTLSGYENGKETATVLCSIGDYYDENGEKVISTATPDKMTFNLHDEVFPMVRDAYGVDTILSNKKFQVLGHRLYFDGAVWQELSLQEVKEQPTPTLTYTLSADGTHYVCSNATDIYIKRIVIADKINDIPVQTIGNNALEATHITSIVIPNTITRIQAYAFQNCAFLEKISIPNSVSAVGQLAFYGCYKLKVVSLPDSVSAISAGTFLNCLSLFNVTMNNVGVISSYAFQSCTSLENINLPKSLITIGEGAFSLCNSLKSISIPENVTNIGANAFRGCTSLESVLVSRSVTEIGANAFTDTNIQTVYYSGTEEEWNAIYIGEGNEGLTSANIIFNWTE